MNAVIGSILRNRSSVKDCLSSTKTIFRHFGRRIERDKSTSDKAVRDEIGGVKKEIKTDNDGSNCDTNVQLPKTFSQEECRIFMAHEKAVEANEETYVDPETGYHVLTKKALLNRRECCGNACRHCPYGHVNVVEYLKTKKYNSKFYI